MLPQFRTLITLPPDPDPGVGADSTYSDKPLRVHFVHARSPHASAFPLLYIHDWPGSFVEISRAITLLTHPSHSPSSSPSCSPTAATQAFHVLAPSIPGFGFSDAAPSLLFGIRETARVFAALMERLGYDEYVVVGAGWGFRVARAMAELEGKGKGGRVRGVFTWDPVFAEPELRVGGGLWRGGVWEWIRWQIARVSGARWGGGYTPGEVREYKDKGGKGAKHNRLGGTALHQLLAARPATMAFSLCDSPVGLLAMLLDLVAAPDESSSSTATTLGARRPRSPFLDPGELELQDREYAAAGHERVRSDDTIKGAQQGGRAEQDSSVRQAWAMTDVLDWTMMCVSFPLFPNPNHLAFVFFSFWRFHILTPIGSGFLAQKQDSAGYAALTSKRSLPHLRPLHDKHTYPLPSA